MKNRNSFLFIALPVVIIFSAIGFFGYGYFASPGMSDMQLSEATTYKSGPFRVTVAINPTAPEVGKNQFTVKVADSSGNPVTGASIKAYGEMAAMATMSAMRAPADLEEVEPGLYAGPLKLEMRGEWPLSLYIKKEGVGETRLGFDMATGREGLSISSGGTPVASAMGSGMDKKDGMTKGDGKMSAGKSPEKNEQGYYTVGKYQIKVEVLGGGSTMSGPTMANGDSRMQKDVMTKSETMRDSMAMQDGMSEQSKGMSMQAKKGMQDSMGSEKKPAMKKGSAMMAGPNQLQVSVQDLDGNPVNGATVRVAAQRDSAMGKMDDFMMDGGAMEKSGGMMQDENMSDGDSMMKNGGNMQNDTAGMPAKRNSEIVQFEPAGDGIYRGALKLPSEGAYALAVDVSTETKGHGDLVLAFTTGEYGLRAATATPEGIAYYTCSMHTSVRESGPGQCPICSMDLVPVTNEQVQSGVITIDARRRQLIGVETGTAIMKDLTKSIRAVGKIDYDERQISNINLKFDAWIGDLKADYVGTKVERGQVLFTVYSPELLSAQQEYLESRQRLASRGPDDSLVQAARKRLMLWDVSAAQVRALERRGQPIEYLPIFAPKSGTVVEKMIVEGSYMKTGDMLLRIADLSTVWADAEVYEADLPLIEEGMSATVTLPYVSGDPIQATVDYIYPYLNPETRTARIRLVLDNAEGALKPDMYAEVHLQADLGRRLVVPEDAVLVAGESRVVFKDMSDGAEDEGKLKPVRVKTGQSVDGWVEITQGLERGDKVITSGNFLIAAETKLKTGINQW